jgi:hypothetical protein
MGTENRIQNTEYRSQNFGAFRAGAEEKAEMKAGGGNAEAF